MKITTTTNSVQTAQKKFTRLVITEKDDNHRFIENADGITEYQMGVGKWNRVTPRTFRTIVRSIVTQAKAHKVENLAIQLSNSSFPKLKKNYDDAWILSTLVENLILADYTYTKYKTKKDTYALKEILICDEMSKMEKVGLDRGRILGKFTNICRDISNTPGGDMTPDLLAKEAKKAAKGMGVSITVLNKKDAKKLKMGALLAVGKGAEDEPKFIVMEYFGAGRPSKKNTKDPIVFVGKGITFDTGGLQVKPGMAMYEMHMDMSGGAAVIAAICACAKLKLKKNIIALIPAAENAISAKAMRPGDVITSMSGKTIDILHTDAEGRLVLADALHYAKKYNPKLVIDVGTLTGAALSALGQHANVVMTPDRKLENSLRDLGEKSGDYTFPLPLWNEFKQYTKGVHGDVANIPSNDSKYGGCINGGMFLSHFTDGLRWAHIDMSPRMTSVPSDRLAKGATGEPVRLLVAIAENF